MPASSDQLLETAARTPRGQTPMRVGFCDGYMHKEWVHKSLSLQPGGYVPAGQPAKQAKPRPQVQKRAARKSRLNVSFIISLATVVTLVLTLPLVIVKSMNTSSPSVYVISLPKIQGGELLPRTNDYFVNRLSPDEQRTFAAQVTFISDIIKSTRNKSIKANELAYLIVSESHKQNHDPLFVASLILAESSFRKEARSSVGALGLMQIRPNTGRYVAKLHHIRWRGASYLTEPRYNISLGINYISYLTKMFNGNVSNALIAYNWGPTNLTHALRHRTKVVPSTSKRYSNKILGNYDRWKTDFQRQLKKYRYMDVDFLRS